jgi:hypothetical protein
MNLLTQQIIDEARKWIGTKEEGRNDGPQIRIWLSRVNRHSGAPWCAAFAWCMLDDACRALGLRNPLEPVAGVHLFRQLAREQKAWTNEPGPGYVFFIDHGVDKAGHRLGHCGIVVGVGPQSLATIEGNTNEAGGREGDRVAIKTRRLGEVSLGYLDPGMLCAGQTCSEMAADQ